MTEEYLPTEETAFLPTVKQPIFDLYLDYDSFDEAQRRAKALASSRLVPKRFQDKISDVLLALNLARRLNSDPLAVMQNMQVINDEPGFSGKFIHALINQSGRFDPLDFDFEHNDAGEVVKRTASSKDRRTDKLKIMSLTWAEVQLAGWDKSRGTSRMPSPWTTFRMLMFTYRTASYFAKAYCPDLILGMTSVEELRDQQPVKVQDLPDLHPKETTRGTSPPTEGGSEDLAENAENTQETTTEDTTGVSKDVHTNGQRKDTPAQVSTWWGDSGHWMYRKMPEFYCAVMVGFGVHWENHLVIIDGIETVMGEDEKELYKAFAQKHPNAIGTLSDEPEEVKAKIQKKLTFTFKVYPGKFERFERGSI